MRKLLLIARREFKLAAANKAFIVITILGPFLIFGVAVLPGLLSANTAVMGSQKPIAVAGAEPGLLSYLEAALEPNGIEVDAIADLETGKRGMATGDYAGCLSFAERWMEEGPRYFTDTGTEIYLYNAIETVVGSYVREFKIASSGIEPALARSLLAQPELRIIRIGEDGERRNDEANFTGILYTAIAFVMLLYISVIFYGQMIGRSVVEEKTSKTVEIMLSSVSTRELMFGKILGLGVAGMVQYGAWVLMGVALVKLVGPAFSLAIPSVITIGLFLWLFLFFVLAFFLYASCYAAVGAAAEDEHHMGQLSFFVLIFLMLPMVFVGTLVMNPESPLCVFLSFFPMTSPIVMMTRILITAVPPWQIAASIALILAAIAACALLASKIFRIGILMAGKRATPREILRWVSLT